MRLVKLGKALLYALAGVLGLLVVGVLAVKFALDRVPAYQDELKSWVRSQTGFNVAFSHVEPTLRWYGPELYFDRLELRSRDGHRVLARAASGRIGADVTQLVRSGKWLAGRLELVAPDISIERLGPHSFALGAELELNPQGDSKQPLTLDDLPAGTLTIRSGRVALLNWNASLPQLLLENVNMVIHRNNDALALRFGARLPAVLGGELGISGSAHDVDDPEKLSWSADVQARDMSFRGWHQLLPELLPRLSAGDGAFKLTAAGKGGGLTDAHLDFAATGVEAQLDAGSTTQFSQIGGALTLSHSADRWKLSGRRIRALQAGRQDPDSEFEVTWRRAPEGLLELQAQASYLRADGLLPLTGLLPQADLRSRLSALAPTGVWTDTHLDLSRRNVAAPWQLRVGARFRDVGFAPSGRAPGVRGLSGTIGGDQSGGHVTLDSHGVQVSWPEQWTEPVTLDTLQSTLYWSRTDAKLLVASFAVDARNSDAAAHLQLALELPANGESPRLTLAGDLSDGNVAAAPRYLPRAILGAQTLNWLDNAFQGGRMPQAHVIFNGPVRQFPFRDGSGIFDARVQLEDLTLNYSDGWPAISRMSGEAEFRNEGLSMRLRSALAGGFRVTGGDARFADFKTGELKVHALAAGDAAEAVAYLRATPLDGMTDGAFSSLEAHGPLRGSLDLFLPLRDFAQRRILVHGQVTGATLHRLGLPLTASELTGDFDLDGPHVARADIHGRLLDGPVQLLAKAPRKRPLTRTQLDLHGTLAGEALQAALGLPPSLALRGTADWQGVVRIATAPARERSLHVASNGVGLESLLGDPLRKAAATALPTTMDVNWPATGGTQINVSLGAIVRAALNYQPAGASQRLAHIAVMFGGAEPVFSDSQVLSVGGKIEQLNLDSWQALLVPDKESQPLSDYLRGARLDVGTIRFLGLAFHQVGLALSGTADQWRLALDGPTIAGTLSVPVSLDPNVPWDLYFQRLRADDADTLEAKSAVPTLATTPASAPGPSASPRSVPALKLLIEDLNWGDRHLGRIQAGISKVADGVSLDQLTVTNPSFTIKAQGNWRGADPGEGRITGTLQSSDVRTTLTQLGYADVMAAKAGHVDFDLNWVGLPTAAAFRSSVGHVEVSLDHGQVFAIKPGAGRVLGLASVAELPRRLALDFSDLTDKGMAFDTVRGDFDLRGGDAFTDNMLLKGPAAEIGLIGRVGLKNRDYDQTAVVTGSVGNSLPLASALAGGPVVGAAVLLFTQVFKQPLRGLARGYYHITGSWDNPAIDRIKGSEAAAVNAEGAK